MMCRNEPNKSVHLVQNKANTLRCFDRTAMGFH